MFFLLFVCLFSLRIKTFLMKMITPRYMSTSYAYVLLLFVQNAPSGSAGTKAIADRSYSTSRGLQKPLSDSKNRAPLYPYFPNHIQPLSISLESLPFHESVVASLKEKRLVGRTRGKFVTDIAKAMIRLKNYPGKSDYDRVSRQVISKWKFLGEQVGHVRYNV